MKDSGFKDKSMQKVMLGFVLGLIVIILCLNFLIIPAFSRLFILFLQTSRLKADMRFIQQDIAGLDILEKKRDSLKMQIVALETRFQDQSKIPIFVEELSRLAEECRIKLIGLKPLREAQAKIPARPKTGREPKEPKDFYEKIPIYVQAECGYHQLGKFINKLEVGERFVEVDDIKIYSNPENPMMHRIDLIINTIAVKTERETQTRPTFGLEGPSPL